MDEQEKNPNSQEPEAASPMPEETPVKEEAPIQEETPVKEEAPIQEETPVEEKAPIQEETPVKEEAPMQEEAPVEEETPILEEAPSEGPKEVIETEKDDSPKPTEIVSGATPGKIAMGVALVVVLLAALIALVVSGRNTEKPSETQPEEQTASATVPVTENTEPAETVPATVPEDGNPDDATCKGTYTAGDEEVTAARNTVVATSGDRELTLGQLQVYYWMEVRSFLNNYGYYLSYFGLDYTQGLDTQVCPMTEEGLTWQQYFLESALRSWQSYTAMAAEAESNNVPMSEENRKELEELDQIMEENAAAAGFESGEELIRMTLGPGAAMDDYAKFMEEYYTGLAYYTQFTENLTVDDGEVEAYFDENAETYQENGITKETVTVDVRHILIMPEGATSETIRTETFPEEAWAAGEEKAQQILADWEAGEKTEESFAALAGEYTQDEGSSTNGGLYEGVSQGQMVEAFDAWCFDTTRQPGDYGIVETEFGYHIMYFRGSTPVWKETARNDLIAQKTDDFVKETANKYPLTVDYSKILLGYVDLAQS